MNDASDIPGKTVPASAGGTLVKITPAREAAYGAPYLMKAVLFTPLLAFVPSFYSVDHGIPLAMVGTILFATRMLDVIVDPFIGIWTDRTRTRWGRRKPFLFAGAPLLLISTWMVLVPPADVTITYAVVWLTLLYLAFTIFDIPYRAWGAELVSGYNGRTRVAAWREGFGMASSLVAMTIIVAAPAVGLGSTAETLRALAALFVVGVPVTVFLTLRYVPEPRMVVARADPISIREQLSLLRSNKPFLWLLGGVVVLLAGAIIGASLHLIVMESYFGVRSWFPIILAGESIAGILSAPLWVVLSRRIGKHRAMALACLLMATFSAFIPFLGRDMGLAYAGIIVARGFAGGALGILTAAMLADVVDVDQLQSGASRGGFFFALVAMVGKLGVALGSLVGLVLPTLFGFDPASKQNTQVALDALLMTYAWIPMLIMGTASYFFWRYPLTEERHASLQREIQGGVVADAR